MCQLMGSTKRCFMNWTFQPFHWWINTQLSTPSEFTNFEILATLYGEYKFFLSMCLAVYTARYCTQQRRAFTFLFMSVYGSQVSVCSTHYRLLQQKQYINVHRFNIITFCWSSNAKWQLLYYKRAKSCNQSSISFHILNLPLSTLSKD